MAWSLVQQGSQAATGSGFQINPALPVASSGSASHPHLLVINLVGNPTTTSNFTLPAGWAQVPGSLINFGTNRNRVEWWYLVDITGGVTTVNCSTGSGSFVIKGMIFEFDPGPNLTIIVPNAVGTIGAAANTPSITVTTGTAGTSGDLVLAGAEQVASPALPIPVPLVLGFSSPPIFTKQYSPVKDNGTRTLPIVSVQHPATVQGIQADVFVNNPPGNPNWIDPPGFTFLNSDQTLGGSGTRHQYCAYKVTNQNNLESVTFSNQLVSISTIAWAGSLVTFTASSASAPPHVGAHIDPNAFNPLGQTMQQCISNWQTYTSRSLPVRYQDFTTIPAAITASLSNDVTAGRKVCMSLTPSFNPPTSTDLGALNTFLSSCKNAGLVADVCLFFDAPSITGMTAALCIAALKFYASTIRQYYPLVFVVGARNAQINNGNTFYPGDAYIDKIATTLYGSQYFGPNSIRLDTVYTLASGAVPRKPFGLWGFNFSSSATGTTIVGAAYSTASYPGSGDGKTAGQELDTYLNGGSWPGNKQLGPRTMAFNMLREYYTTDPLSTGGTGWPTSAANDGRHLANRAADGVKNVAITVRPARDGTNAYTGATYTNEFNNLVSSITYITSIFPNARFTLWHEANIFGIHGPFGNGSSTTGLGSPYGPNVTVPQMHANWAAYVKKYGPAFKNAGVPLFWMPSMASPVECIDFFDIALNATQQGYFTGVGSDNYTGNFIDNTGAIFRSLTTKYGTNNLSMLDLAAKYSLPYSAWEVGAGTGQPAADNVLFLNSCITTPLTNWIAAGNPVGEILWFNYGGDVIGPAMAPTVLSAVQNMYDSLQNAGSSQAQANQFFGYIQSFFTSLLA